jgi:uncharacterized protein YciI
MQFAYWYWMTDQPAEIRAIAPKHAAYWQRLALPRYLGGPFDDRTGGLISFEATSQEAAAQLVADDPFTRADLVTEAWLKVWSLEP